MNQSNQLKLIRLRTVIDKTGWPKTTLQTRVKNREFVMPISIGDRAVAWVESEVNQIIEAMIAGKSKCEIKFLVKELHRTRKNGGTL